MKSFEVFYLTNPTLSFLKLGKRIFTLRKKQFNVFKPYLNSHKMNPLSSSDLSGLLENLAKNPGLKALVNSFTTENVIILNVKKVDTDKLNFFTLVITKKEAYEWLTRRNIHESNINLLDKYDPYFEICILIVAEWDTENLYVFTIIQPWLKIHNSGVNKMKEENISNQRNINNEDVDCLECISKL